MKNFPAKSPRAGFSIIEVLIATTITATLGVVLVALTSDILRLWRQSGGQLSLNSEARLALSILEEDFQGLFLRNDGRAWILTGDQSERDWNPSAENALLPGTENKYAGFFRNSSEGPRAVLYRLIEQPLFRGGTQREHQLVRTEMAAGDTLVSAMDWRENAIGMNWPDGYRALVEKGDIESERFEGAPNDEPFVTRDIIATKVISFDIEFFPNESSPREIVIRLTFLSSQGLERLRNFEAGRIALPADQSEEAFRAELLSRESRTFRKVIYPKAEL